MKHARIATDHRPAVRPPAAPPPCGGRRGLLRRVAAPVLALGAMLGLDQWIAAQIDDQIVALLLILVLAATLGGLLAPAFGGGGRRR